MFAIEAVEELVKMKILLEMFKEHWKFLSLSVIVDGVKKYFVFTCRLFCLNDAARTLIKLLRFPLQRWQE